MRDVPARAVEQGVVRDMRLLRIRVAGLCFMSPAFLCTQKRLQSQGRSGQQCERAAARDSLLRVRSVEPVFVFGHFMPPLPAHQLPMCSSAQPKALRISTVRSPVRTVPLK